MKTKITFRHMDHSSVMEEYAEGQLQKVYEFLSNEPDPVFVDLILEPSKVHEHHKVELRIKSPHYDLISNYEGAKFYDVLDRVIDVMYKRLREEKKKEVDQRKMRGRHDDFKKQR